MISNSVVCNIKPVIFYRFILGMSQYLKTSSNIHRLLKLYPIVLVSFIIIYPSSLYQETHWFHRFLINGEYLCYFLISFRTKDEHIYSWFKYLHPIDSLPGATKIYRKLEVFILLSMTYSVIFNNWWVHIRSFSQRLYFRTCRFFLRYSCRLCRRYGKIYCLFMLRFTILSHKNIKNGFGSTFLQSSSSEWF